MSKKVFKMIVGNDNGNNEQCIIINGKIISQPNVIARKRDIPNFENRDMAHLVKDIHNYSVGSIVSSASSIVETGLYAGGNYAVESREPKLSIPLTDNDKIHSPIVYVNTLLNIAGAGFQKAYDENEIGDSEIDIVVDMATALPISHYNKKTAKEFADNFMNGTHRVTITLKDISQTFNIKFEYVKVIPEGVNTMHALYNIPDLIPEMGPKDFKDKLIQHVSIGEGTSEYPTTNGLGFSEEHIEGYPNGIGHAIERTLPTFKKRRKINNLSRQEFSKIIRNPNSKYHEEALSDVTHEIQNEAFFIKEAVLSELERSNNMADMVLVYGGGSILMKDHLKESLEKHCEAIDSKLVYIEDPELAVQIEARGLYAFAESKLFGKLKEKELPALLKEQEVSKGE